MRRVRDRGHALAPALVIHDASLLLAVFYAPIFWGGFNSSGLTMAATLVSVAAVSAVIWRWRALDRGPATIPNAIHLPALVFLGVSAVCALFSASTHSSLLELSRLVTGAVLFLLVANRALMPPTSALPVAIVFGSSLLIIPFVKASGESGVWLDLFTGLAVVCVGAFLIVHRNAYEPVRRWVEALVLSAGLAVALSGIREKVSAHYYLDNPTWQIFSTFFNPNELAGFFALVIPIALALAASPQKPWSRLILGFAAFALAIAIVPTNSKGAYLALLVALAALVMFLALISGRPRRNVVLTVSAYLLVALLATAVIVVLPAVRAKVVAGFDAQTASNMFRILTWKGTLMMASHHLWLGIGPAAFKSVYMNYAVVGYTEAAHESYLQVLAEQGVFGILAFVWLLGGVLFTGWRAMRRPAADRGSRLLAAGGLAGFIAFLVHSLVDYGWYIGATNLTLWFIAGMLAHLSHGRALAQVPTLVGNSAPRAKRRRLAEPMSAPPARNAPEHTLPWPRSNSLRPLTLLGLTVALSLCVWIAARNALAQEAMTRGDATMTEAILAEQQGNLALALQRYQESLPIYQAAADCDPGWAVIHEKLGLSLRDEPGEQHLKRAVEMEPQSFAPRLSLARFYDQKGRFPEAVRAYQESLNHFPQHTRALRLLAETYRKMGEEDKALDTYRRLADLDDEPMNRYRAVDIDVDANFAYAYYELGRAELRPSWISSVSPAAKSRNALHWLQQCVAVVDEYFKPHGGYDLDRMFAKVGKPRTNRAEELRPLKAKALWRMAEAYEVMGRHGKAVASRNQAEAAFAKVAQLIADENAGERK